MISIIDILRNSGGSAVEKIKSNYTTLDAVASGKTKDSFESEVTEGDGIVTLRILADKASDWSETGRPPRESNVQSEPSLTERILEWMPFRGLGNDKGLARFIAYRINRDGTKLWQQGKGSVVKDIYTSEFDRLLESVQGQITNEYAISLRAEFKEKLEKAWVS
jgi:hypothetical protein